MLTPYFPLFDDLIEVAWSGVFQRETFFEDELFN